MFFEIEPDVSARAELGVLDESFLVMFAGTLGIAQALPSVIQAARASDPGVDFVFIGDGPGPRDNSIVRPRMALRTSISIRRSRSVTCLGFLPQQTPFS